MKNLFVVLIRSHGEPPTQRTEAEQTAHITKTKAYLGRLSAGGHLKAALPLELAGTVVRSDSGRISSAPAQLGDAPVVGYYQVEAEDQAHAVKLMRDDPRLHCGQTWSLEVRPVLSVPGISD